MTALPPRGVGDVLAHSIDGDLPVPDTTEPMITRSVRLPVSTSQQLDASAAARGIDPTVLARHLIEAGLGDLSWPATHVVHTAVSAGWPVVTTDPADYRGTVDILPLQ